MNIQLSSPDWSELATYDLYDSVAFPEEEIIAFDEANTVVFVSPGENLDIKVDNTSAGLFLPNRGEGDYVIIPSGKKFFIKDYGLDTFSQELTVRDNVYQGANILPLRNDGVSTIPFNFLDQNSGKLLHKTGYYYSLVENNSGNKPTDTLNSSWTKKFVWKPSYGSTVNFKAFNSEVLFGDGYSQILNKGLNSLRMSMDLKFEEKDDKESKAMIHFLENKKGVIDFEFDTYKPYEKTNSFLCSNFSHKIGYEQSNDISAKFENFNESVYLKWDSLFMDSPESWVQFQEYEKFDIVKLNDSGNLGHYYAIQDVKGVDVDDAPDELNSLWTKGIFFFRPDFEQEISQSMRTNNSEVSDDGFLQPFTDGINPNVTNLNLTFSNRSEKEAKAIIDFLIQKKGYKKIIYSPTTHYGDYKYYYCPEWSHTYNFYDNHTVTASFKGLAYKVTEPVRPVELTAFFKNPDVPLITLEWGSSYNADYYKVYRSTDPAMAGEELVSTVLDPLYLDTGYAEYTQYYYQIESLNDLGVSDRSFTYKAPVFAPVPSGIVDIATIIP